MATFSTKKILYGSTFLIPTIANRIQEEFQNDGYEVAMDALSSGGYDISITKGGVFKAVLHIRPNDVVPFEVDPLAPEKLFRFFQGKRSQFYLASQPVIQSSVIIDDIFKYPGTGGTANDKEDIIPFARPIVIKALKGSNEFRSWSIHPRQLIYKNHLFGSIGLR